MAENSKIEWTDHTFNPWVGCTKVSPACDHCYAEGWAKRTGQSALWAGERRRTSAANWRLPYKWNNAAPLAGPRQRVFCASLADVFDNQVPPEWRRDLFWMIRETPNLDWLLLTKRPQNIAKMLPDGWGAGYPNVWLGTTVENQVEADRRIPHLRDVRAEHRFLSMEPLLGPVDLSALIYEECPNSEGMMMDPETGAYECCSRCDFTGIGEELAIDWIIVGGESGPGARPMHPDWARDLRDQCAAAGVAYHFKQWGEWAPGENAPGPQTRTETGARWFNDEWSMERITPRMGEELHCDDAPDVWRFGKKAAGRLLDGVEHNGMPG